MEMLYIFIIIITLTFFILFYKLLSEQKNLKKEIAKQATIINQLMLKDLISSEGSASEDILKQNLLPLARRIFKFIKIKGRFKATSYPELVEELKNSNIEPNLKNDLIEFFNAISLIEYSNEKLSDEKREELRLKALKIIKRVEQFQELQV
ncbi:MAG: hypothetical protein QW480_00695 [Candidatus Aenigmatarchaeota archaeon]